MSGAVYYDSDLTDDVRRKKLFEGDLFVFSPRASTTGFIRFARSLIEEAFGGVDPRKAQDRMGVEEYAALLGKLKPSFIHHPDSKRHIQNIFREFGCDV